MLKINSTLKEMITKGFYFLLILSFILSTVGVPQQSVYASSQPQTKAQVSSGAIKVNGALQDNSTEVSTEVTPDSPTGIPTSSPTNPPATDTSTSIPTVVPSDTATIQATETSAPAPSDTPTTVPTVVPSDTATVQATDTSAPAPSDTPTAVATDTPVESSTNSPTEVATETPVESPTIVTTETATPQVKSLPKVHQMDNSDTYPTDNPPAGNLGWGWHTIDLLNMPAGTPGYHCYKSTINTGGDPTLGEDVPDYTDPDYWTEITNGTCGKGAVSFGSGGPWEAYVLVLDSGYFPWDVNHLEVDWYPNNTRSDKGDKTTEIRVSGLDDSGHWHEAFGPGSQNPPTSHGSYIDYSMDGVNFGGDLDSVFDKGGSTFTDSSISTSNYDGLIIEVKSFQATDDGMFSLNKMTVKFRQIGYINTNADANDCPECDALEKSLSNIGNAMDNVGDPVNTYTGEMSESYADLSLPTIDGPLAFTRTYSSAAAYKNDLVPGSTTTLGSGWSDNQDIKLYIDPNSNQVKLKAQTANFYGTTALNSPFQATPPPERDDPGVMYPAAAGMADPYHPYTFTVSYNAATDHYTQSDANQDVYTFDSNGRLLSLVDKLGRGFTYTYGGSGLLTQVSDETGDRYLSLTYDGNTLTTVTANTVDPNTHQTSTQSVSYGYDANGDLTSFTDTNGGVWNYTYNGAHQMLTEMHDGHYVVRNYYDPATSKIACQQAGDAYHDETVSAATNDNGNYQYIDCQYQDSQGAYHDVPATSFTYKNYTETDVRDPLGNISTHHYDDWGNLIEVDALNDHITKAYDTYLNIAQQTKDGVSTSMAWGPNQTLDKSTSVTYSGNQRTIITTYSDQDEPKKVQEQIGDGSLQTLSQINYELNNPYLIEQQTDALGNSISYQYNSNNLVSSIMDANGLVTAYTYNEFGQVETATDPYGNKTTTYYNSLNGLPQEEIDPNGRTTWICYDNANRMSKKVINPTVSDPCTDYTPSTDADKDLIATYAYDSFGNLIESTSPDNKVTCMYYDGDNRSILTIGNASQPCDQQPAYDPGKPDQNIHLQEAYDDNGNVISATDTYGRVTKNFYNADNKLIETIQNYTGDGTFNANAPDQNIATWTYYDSNNNPIATKNVYGVVDRTYIQAGSGLKIAEVKNLQIQDDNTLQDSNYYLEQNFKNDITATTNLLTTYTYDDDGNQIAVTDPKGVVTRTYYNLLNEPVTVVANLQGQSIDNDPPIRDDNNLSQNVRIDTYYDAGGRKIATKDPLGVVTRTYYDHSQQKSTVVHNLNYQKDDDISNDGFDYSYHSSNPDNNIISTNQTITNPANAYPIEKISIDASGNQVVGYYDNLGQLMEQQAINSQLVISSDTKYAYDRAGNKITTKSLDPTNSNNVLMNYSYGYDALGRQISSTSPLPNSGTATSLTTYGGNGTNIQTTDPNGVVIRYDYDALNRLIDVINHYAPGKNPSSDTNVETQYAYNGANGYGNLTSVIDANDHQTTYAYDALGRTVSETDPRNKTTIYAYDADSNEISVLDANHQAGAGDNTQYIHYTYTNLSQLTGITYPTDISTAGVAYTYDLDGRKLTMADGTGTTTWHYDALGRVTSIDEPNDGNTQTIGYEYNPLGQPTKLIYPNANQSISYQYDEGNRLKQETVNLGSSQQQISYSYDTLNRVSREVYPNNVYDNYSYDAAGRLASILYSRNSDGSDQIASFGYTYDSAGNRIGETDTTLSATDPNSVQLEKSQLNLSVKNYGGNPAFGAVISLSDGSSSSLVNADGSTSLWVNAMAFPLALQIVYNGKATSVHITANNQVVTLPNDTSEIRQVVDDGNNPVVGTSIYAYAGNVYLGKSATTDSQGNATFNQLSPDPGYSFARSPSDPVYATNNFTVTVYDSNHNPVSGIGVTATTTDGGQDQTDYNVPTGISGTTSSDGTVTLALPVSPDPAHDFQFEFRARVNDSLLIYSTIPVSSSTCGGQNSCAPGNQITLPPLRTVSVTVNAGAGSSNAGVPVYVFQNGQYSGVSAATNSSGVAAFLLPAATTYSFRTFNSGQFQDSGACDQNCMTAAVSIPALTAVSVTVNGAGASDSARVFVFTGASFDARSYAGISGNTDSTGQVTFQLPDGTYWFGSLLDGAYSMESASVSCSLPGCASITLQRASGNFTVTTTIHYTYDALDRLSEADYNSAPSTAYSLQYGYDAAGNRLSTSSTVAGNAYTTNYSYDDANRLQTATTNGQASSYTWDDNGNLQSIKNPDGSTARSFTFDGANRLTKLVISGGATYSYVYNGLGDRIKQTVGSATSLYTLDLNSDLPQVLSDGTNLYIPGIGQAAMDGSAPEFYLTDGNGSTRLITDATGAVIGDPQNYDPFGNTGDTPSSPIGYSGEWKDASGLIYLRARYYDPGMGRFISKDPLSGNIEQPDTMNGWIYGANNPLTYSDPSGKCYGILSWERGVQGLSTLCTYMDEAYAISGCSNATSEEKLLANSYITGMVFSQAAFVLGGGYLAGEAGLATLGTLGSGLTACAATGNCQDEINTAVDTEENIESDANISSDILKNDLGDKPNIEQLIKDAKELYPKLADKANQLHHIFPKYLGGDSNGPVIPLNPAYHQLITNAFRSLWAYGQGAPSVDRAIIIMNQVYSEFPLPIIGE